MNNLLKLQALAAEEEQIETLTATGMLRREGDQKNYVCVKDVIIQTGIIRMWTVLEPFHDARGYNRQFSTFSVIGLREIGMIRA